MRTCSAAGRDFIKSFEQCRLVAYRDSNGTWTLGWGHTGHDVGAGIRWTQQEADAAFDRDLFEVEFAVSKFVRVPLTQNEFDALCSFAFNVGVHAFETSTLLRKLNAGAAQDAASEFQRWDKETKNGKKVSNRGLAQRRAAERAMFLGLPCRIVGKKQPTGEPA